MNAYTDKKCKKIKRWYLKLLALYLLLLTLSGCASADKDAFSGLADTSETVGWQEEENRAGESAGRPETETELPQTGNEPDTKAQAADVTDAAADLASIPPYSSSPYVELNGNIPGFSEADLTTESFEYYSELDALGRCQTAYANIGQDLMPTEERGEIGQIRPSGWHTVKYDNIDGMYLYNRCHLIGYQLTGENANERNLITGTRYMNVEGMLPFENMVADYINDTNHHVLYRVTPVFSGDDLVARGVQMEAYSVEDQGSGICFNVFVYNVQPGIDITYADGESAPAQNRTKEPDAADAQQATYILNTKSMKFHDPSCSGIKEMSDANKQEYTGSREELLSQGYEPCKSCNP